MAMGRWWKRRRLDLDDDDFKAEVEAHLAMAEAERVAEGADREAAHFAALKDFGNVTRTTEAARRVWTPGWLEALRDLTSDVRHAIRSLCEAAGVRAHRDRRAGPRHRLERRRLHHAQGHRAHPARRCDRSARLHVIHAETSTGRALSCRIPTTSSCATTTRRFPASSGRPWPTSRSGEGAAPVRCRPSWSPGTTSTCSASVPSAAASSSRRTRLRPASIRSSSSATGCGGTDFGADPDIVGTTVEINNVPLTVVGDRRRQVSRHDRQLRRRGVHAGDDGAAARLHLRQPARRRRRRILADRSAAVFYPQGFLRPGATPGHGRRRRATRCGPRCRAIGRWAKPWRGCGSCRSSSRRAAARPTSCRC